MTTTPHDNVTTWRELADQLTPEQFAELEYCEREQIPPGLADPEHQLNAARIMAQSNIIQAVCADVAPPPGAPEFVADWEVCGDRYSRLFDGGTARTVGDATVYLYGLQFNDGSIERRITLSIDDEPITAAEARQLAAALIAAADDLDDAECAAAIAACTICDDRGRIRRGATADGTPTHRASMCRHDDSEIQR